MSAAAWGAEVGLVTSITGRVLLQEEKAASELKPFVKLRAGDRLTLEGAARLQVVYFDGGRQETWQGAGQLEIGARAGNALKGGLQPEVKVLPAILVKQLSKTPSADDGVKAGMVRMRSMPTGGTLESLEKNYAELRKQADAADHNPELYPRLPNCASTTSSTRFFEHGEKSRPATWIKPGILNKRKHAHGR
jgi:hypothetical protein